MVVASQRGEGVSLIRRDSSTLASRRGIVETGTAHSSGPPTRKSSVMKPLPGPCHCCTLDPIIRIWRCGRLDPLKLGGELADETGDIAVFGMTARTRRVS